MRISLVLSLEHFSCSKIVSSFFNEVLPLIEVRCLHTSKLLENSSPALNMDSNEIYNMIHSKIVHKIKCLTSSIVLQKKMEKFIEPMFYEIEKWLEICKCCMFDKSSSSFIILKSIARCWFPDGTLDREKSVKVLIENNDVNPTDRFTAACYFCLLDDVLNIWKILSDERKMDLRNSMSFFVTYFIEWLDSVSEKDSQSFASWSLASPFWGENVHFLKYVLKTLSSVEKKRYLMIALTKIIDDRNMIRFGSDELRDRNDIMRFGLSLMTEDEQQFIFKECPVEVFRCITSWPMRSNFFDIVDILWPLLTEDAFCNILNMLLLQIRDQKSNNELIIIFQKFWAQSPLAFKDFANENWSIYLAMHYVLEHDLSKPFRRETFLYFVLEEFNGELIDYMNTIE